MDKQKTPQEEREKLRQGEQKQNPTGNLRDGFDRGAGSGNVTDIAGDMDWKGMTLLILLLVGGYVIYRLFFS